MDDRIKQHLVWFLESLDLQIEDFELERNGIVIDLYFDTVDVSDAILGMHAYYSPLGEFDREKSCRESALVDNLAGGGWLGPISMLPPHQRLARSDRQ